MKLKYLVEIEIDTTAKEEKVRAAFKDELELMVSDMSPEVEFEEDDEEGQFEIVQVDVQEAK